MSLIISGLFKDVAHLRNYIQGDKEPYVESSRGGYTCFCLEQDIGGGEAVMVLYPVGIKDKEPAAVREKFRAHLEKTYPNLEFKSA